MNRASSHVTLIQCAAIIGVSPSRIRSLCGAGYLHPIDPAMTVFHRWEAEHLAVNNRLCKRRKRDEVQFALPYD